MITQKQAIALLDAADVHLSISELDREEDEEFVILRAQNPILASAYVELTKIANGGAPV